MYAYHDTNTHRVHTNNIVEASQSTADLKVLVKQEQFSLLIDISMASLTLFISLHISCCGALVS